MRKSCLLLLIYFSFLTTGFAKPVLPEIMSDNMVLQQKTNVNIWGKADAGKTIAVG